MKRSRYEEKKWGGGEASEKPNKISPYRIKLEERGQKKNLKQRLMKKRTENKRQNQFRKTSKHYRVYEGWKKRQ